MTFPIPAMLLALQLATPAADGVPQFNTEPTCRGAGTASNAVSGATEV